MAKIEHIKNKRGEVIYPVSKEGAIYDENGVLLSTKIATFITRLVDNLANYYLKSETYTKGEVDELIGAIQGFTYIVVSELPTASAETMGIVYLVPSEDPQTQNVKDEYITIRSGVEGSYTYSWEQIGSTAIDLSGYVTTEALNTALADYTTTANLTTLLAAKQDTIADLSTIRSGAAAGATAYQKPGTGIPATDMASGVQTSLGKADSAYQKPSGGIPKTDLESGVQGSLELADSAVQADPIGSIVPPVDPSEFATKEEVEGLEAEVDEIGDVVFQGTQTTDITSSLTISDKSYSRENGTANQTGQHSTPIPVSPGEKYLVSGKTGYYTCLIAEFNSSDVFIQGVGINTGGQLDMVDYEYTVPEGVAKVGFSTRDATHNPITVKKVVNKTIADVLDELDLTKADKSEVTEILINKNSDVFSVSNGTDAVADGVHTLVYDGNQGFVRLTQSVDKELLPQEKDKVIYIGALMYIDKRMNLSAGYGLDIKINCVDGFITLSGEANPLVGKWYLISAAYKFAASATNQNFSVLFSANFGSTGQSGSTAKMKGFFISDTLQGFSVEDTKLLYDALLTKIGWDLSAPIPAYSKTATFKRLINEEKVKATIPQDITVTVGASGDFPNINAAMNYLSQFYPAYLPGGVHAFIKILSGTTITDQVFVDGVDWSWMTIIYEDYNPELLNYDNVAADIANGTIVFDSTTGYNAIPVNASAFRGVTHDSRGDECLFRAENGGKLPTIGCVFKLVTDSEHGCCGVLCNRGSECVVKTLCGFIGFKDGVISNNESSITIREGITMNCTRWGCHARHNGEVSARSVIATGCGSIGTTEAGAAVADRVANMDVREAYLGNSRVAIRASNASMICARAAHIIGGGVSGVYLVQAEYSGIINASQIEFSNVTGAGLSVNNGGQMDAFSLIGSPTFNVTKNEVSANGIIYG